mgnify:CR=1 FL=1
MILVDIKNRLLELPVEIKNAKKGLLTLQESLIEQNEALKKWELEQMNDIANAVDAAGKALYSNDIKRQAELQNRKEASDAYKELKNKVESLTYQIKVTEIDVAGLYDEQGNLRAICKLEEVA